MQDPHSKGFMDLVEEVAPGSSQHNFLPHQYHDQHHHQGDMSYGDYVYQHANYSYDHLQRQNQYGDYCQYDINSTDSYAYNSGSRGNDYGYG